MNPTTLKSLFKETYGDSIASHIKEHRMEYASTLLTSTDLSLNEISRNVGYESQSKFSSAFKETFGMLPSEYRKNN
ncbi:MAG: helix-turn-helix transcriptional regulator [Lachnospiraceae bacterium]|nr:helix-turn-helix transcriptional regulator [Lachnospiraceae bacterium]